MIPLGGDPMDPKNLWPEPYSGESDGARDKDQVENALHRAVCDGETGLAEAQRLIAEDWTTALSSLPAKQETSPLSPPPSPAKAANCSPAYPTVCIPPPPPDLDCKDIPYRNFQGLPPDPHRFDADHDGIGCES